MMASNLRIIHENKLNLFSIAASSEEPLLTTNNLYSSFKSDVWRSTSTTATLQLSSLSSTSISCVVLAFTNLTSTSTIRVRLFQEVLGALLYDSGVTSVIPSDISSQGGVNTFSRGGGGYAVVYTPKTTCKQIVIDITDSNNPSNYIEASFIIVGDYFSPSMPVSFGGLKAGYDDSTKQNRTETGDSIIDIGSLRKCIDIDLNLLTKDDMNSLWSILRKIGSASPIFISVTPDSEDKIEEYYLNIYGRISKLSMLSYSAYNQGGLPLSIEEI